MIDIHFSVSDDSAAVDNESCCHGQYPGIVAIEPLKVNAQGFVYFLKFFREDKVQV